MIEPSSRIKPIPAEKRVYMHRCIELARLGIGLVAPNPMVGAVLVCRGKIIGEGYHQYYAEAHAEINCLNAVSQEDSTLISEATLYVSLEPCAHFGKTPPCADAIISRKIPRVVVGCRDPYPEVNGRGIERLRAAGVEVEEGVMEDECKELNKRFFTFVKSHRPYIILKWAQGSDGMVSSADGKRIQISSECTNRLVHKWRAEESAILVGTKTALLDNPELNVRLWKGRSPIRIVIDKKLTLPQTHHLLDQKIKTIIFNSEIQKEEGNLSYYKFSPAENDLQQMTRTLYDMQIQSILVEGGPHLLQSFIDMQIWDEARIITNESMTIGNGISAPILGKAKIVREENLQSDIIRYFERGAS